MSLQDIVNVNITRQTTAVSRVGFGTMNVFGTNKAFTELIKYFASLSEVAALFNTTDKEYIAASDAFAQNPTVTQIAISRRATADTSVVTVDTATTGATYTIVIDGVSISIVAVGATATDIAGEIVSAINGEGSINVGATDNLDGTFDLDPDIASTAYAVKVDSKCSIAFTTTDTIANDLTNINESDNDWYGLVFTDRDETNVKAVMDWVETQTKVFVTASADADIANLTDAADTGASQTIAGYAKAQSLARTTIFYHEEAATEFLDAGFLGRLLPLDPGSYTGKFKTIASVTVNNLNSTKQKNITDKNANFYQLTGGVNITCNGTVSEGEYFDVIVFIDWLQARMTERIFSTLVNNDKIPFTDGGIAAIEADVSAQLQDGIAVGGLASNPQPVVTVPLASEVSAVDKANRELNDVEFSATLAGAIHAVTVNGTVSV